MNKYMFLIDFDGTISKTDSTTALGKKLQPELTEEALAAFRMNKIGVREYVEMILENLYVNEKQFRETLHEVMIMDTSFIAFIEKGYSYRIVSSGSDKNIKYSLEKLGIKVSKEILHTNCLNFKGRNTSMEYPYFDAINGVNKTKIVQKYKNEGYTTIFIGDGPSDFQVAGIADYTYAIKNTKLEALCIENNIAYTAVEDFHDVIMLFEENHLYHSTRKLTIKKSSRIRRDKNGHLIN